MAETWFDLPYYYVFDGRGLVDGARYENLNVSVQDDAEFRLRAIHGISNVGQLMNLIDQDGKQVFRGPSIAITEPLLLPEEIVYEPGSQIRFGLSNVSRAFSLYSNGTTREYLAKIVFAGVKRFNGSAAEQIKSMHYPQGVEKFKQIYYGRGASYTVNWYGKVAPAWVQDQPPRLFQSELDDRGMDVFAVQWVAQNGLLLTNNQIEVMPYDITNRSLANDYVPVGVMNYAPGMEEQLFPAVPLYWPPQSMIRFGIRSVMTDTSAPFPLTFQLTLFGARRIPC